MGKVFSVEDRENAFRFILSAAGNCSRIIALVQVGSGAEGYRDDRSDLDFVIALDSDESMPEVMDYMHREIAGKYDDVYAHCTVVDYNIDVKKALQEHPEYENMIC